MTAFVPRLNWNYYSIQGSAFLLTKGFFDREKQFAQPINRFTVFDSIFCLHCLTSCYPVSPYVFVFLIWLFCVFFSFHNVCDYCLAAFHIQNVMQQVSPFFSLRSGTGLDLKAPRATWGGNHPGGGEVGPETFGDLASSPRSNLWFFHGVPSCLLERCILKSNNQELVRSICSMSKQYERTNDTIVVFSNRMTWNHLPGAWLPRNVCCQRI